MKMHIVRHIKVGGGEFDVHEYKDVEEKDDVGQMIGVGMWVAPLLVCMLIYILK